MYHLKKINFFSLLFFSEALCTKFKSVDNHQFSDFMQNGWKNLGQRARNEANDGKTKEKHQSRSNNNIKTQQIIKERQCPQSNAHTTNNNIQTEQISKKRKCQQFNTNIINNSNNNNIETVVNQRESYNQDNGPK